jgi:cysteine desulfurase
MEQPKLIYLDHHATTPVDSRVLEAMLPYFTEIYANAASIDHEAGHRANVAVEHARQQCAQAIHARPEEIIFTSGATESDNLALLGVAERYADKGDHIITCATEHKAVLDCCARLERQGKRITILPVDQYGLVDPETVRKAITPQTILISIMAANNEIGTIAPIAEIGAIAREHGVFFHTDGAQAVGHIPIDVQAMQIDLLSFSAHKIYGPKGIGGLYIRGRNHPVRPAAVIYGGGHERGFRSGTLNVPGIVGMGKALELATQQMTQDAKQYRAWTQMIREHLQQHLGDSVQFHGHPTQRLPHNLHMSLQGIESKSLVVLLKHVALSTGSACTTAVTEPSHVLLAIGLREEQAHQAIRIGVGRGNTDEEIALATETIITAIQKLQRLGSGSLRSLHGPTNP